MKKFEITNLNVNIYQKLLDIKEGKILPNNKCFFIPALLIGIESFMVLAFLIVNPMFISYMGNSILHLIQLVLYCVVFIGITKVNIGLSKKMGVYYFKREYPNIEADVDINELKRKLREYRRDNNSKNNISKNESVINRNIDSSDRLNDLRREKEFLMEYHENEKAEEKDKIIKKKF